MAKKDSVTKTIGAQNIFTDELLVDEGDRVSVSGQPGAASTVTLQRRMDGTNWRDVNAWSADVETTYVVDEACILRFGIKTGDYGASTTVRLGKG